MNHVKLAAGLVLCAVTIGAAIVATPRVRAAAESVSFTAAQAKAGRRAYETTCSMCHGAALEGGAGPALSGPNFKTLSEKVKANVGDIFTYMTTNMPMNAPASLSHADYAAIMAFILSKNGYAPGAKALTYDAAMASKASIIKR